MLVLLAGCGREIDLGGVTDDLLIHGAIGPGTQLLGEAGPCAAVSPSGPCSDPGLSCGYAQVTCDCVGSSSPAWLCCVGSAACPDQEPVDGDPCCPLAQGDCTYGLCESGSSRVCTCVGHRFQCTSTSCPMGSADLGAAPFDAAWNNNPDLFEPDAAMASDAASPVDAGAPMDAATPLDLPPSVD
jgi:hypothetical protein